MKKRKLIFVLVNVVIVVVSVVVYNNYRSNTDLLKSDYHSVEKELKQIATEYADSTQKIKKYFSGKAIFDYAKKIDDDSLRNFVLTQGNQWRYYFAYHSRFETQIKTFQLEIEFREKFVNILVLVFVITVIFNLAFFIISNRKE